MKINLTFNTVVVWAPFVLFSYNVFIVFCFHYTNKLQAHILCIVFILSRVAYQ